VSGALSTVYKTGRRLRKVKVMKKLRVVQKVAGKCMEGVLKEELQEGAVQI
jgi:hypothetical protein